jgi:elongation factor Ts
MTISAQQIKELRETSGAGMMDCKKALLETNGNIEEAIDWLRTKGLAKAAKKAGRVAAEGLIAIAHSGNKASIIELNSETDFVARNEQFQQIAEHIAAVALKTEGDAESVKAAHYPTGGKNVGDTITEAIATIGENMNLRRSRTISVKQGLVSTYIHNAVKPNLGKIGVILAINSDKTDDRITALGKQIAMHIAAAKPEALNRESVDASSLERERAVFKEQAIQSGKSEEIAEKMVEGRIRKFYEEVVLPEQTFVIDGKSKISEVIDQVAKETGAKISLADYAMFILGEGIEKEEDDFAAEVKKAAGAA